MEVDNNDTVRTDGNVDCVDGSSSSTITSEEDADPHVGVHTARGRKEVTITKNVVEDLINNLFFYWTGEGPYAPYIENLNPSPVGMGSMNRYQIPGRQQADAHFLDYDIRSAELFVVHCSSFTTNFQVYLRAKWTVTMYVYQYTNPTTKVGGAWTPSPEYQAAVGILDSGHMYDEMFLIYSSTENCPVDFEVNSNRVNREKLNIRLNDVSAPAYSSLKFLESEMKVTNLHFDPSGYWESRRMTVGSFGGVFEFVDGQAVFSGDHRIPEDYNPFHLSFSAQDPYYEPYVTNNNRRGPGYHGWRTNDPSWNNYNLAPREHRNGRTYNNILGNAFPPTVFSSLAQDQEATNLLVRRLVDLTRYNYYEQSVLESSNGFFDSDGWMYDESYCSGGISCLTGGKIFRSGCPGSSCKRKNVSIFFMEPGDITRGAYDYRDSLVVQNDYIRKVPGNANPYVFWDAFTLLRENQGYVPANVITTVNTWAVARDVENPTWMRPVTQDPRAVNANGGDEYGYPYVRANVDFTLFANNPNGLTQPQIENWAEAEADGVFRPNDRAAYTYTNLNDLFGWRRGERYRGHCPLTGTAANDFSSYTYPDDRPLTVVKFVGADPSDENLEKDDVLLRILVESTSKFEAVVDPLTQDGTTTNFSRNQLHSSSCKRRVSFGPPCSEDCDILAHAIEEKKARRARELLSDYERDTREEFISSLRDTVRDEVVDLFRDVFGGVDRLLLVNRSEGSDEEKEESYKTDERVGAFQNGKDDPGEAPGYEYVDEIFADNKVIID